MRLLSAFIPGSWPRKPVVGLVILASTGCATELRMSELRDPNQPTATIRYSAVRHETRRFPDYSVIDGSVLASDSSTHEQDDHDRSSR